MGLVSKTVKVKWNGKTRKHYEDLGYKYTKKGDEFEVKVEDLQKGSSVKVDCVCDNCRNNLLWSYFDYNRYVKENGKTYCKYCALKLYGGENSRKTRIEKGKSFAQWCIKNNRKDVLDRWDYELNNCSPNDINYSTATKYWFKCDKHPEHKSEFKNILSFTNGVEGSISCNQCNSFAQWCIDNNRQDVLNRWDYELNGLTPWDISCSTHKKYWFKCNKYTEHKSELKSVKDFINGHEGSINCNQCNSFAQWCIDNNLNINDYWDFEKNIVDPWELSYGSNKKVWFKCTTKKYHGSYEMVCSHFTRGERCPYCYNRSVHPKDSLGQYIIDEYGEEFLWLIWSDKNKKSPFEYAPNSNYKVWWKCLDKKHEDYLRYCNMSVKYEFRCPKCVEEMNNSVIENKTKSYLYELGYSVLTEHNCTIRPINPKNKYPMPFDNEIILKNGKHLIIEVHGKQHYKHNFYKTMYNLTEEEAQNMLHQRQLYDRYKRIKCKQASYEYLEIPYTAFEGKNKEQYKQMIDNKIEEILNIDKTS